MLKDKIKIKKSIEKRQQKKKPTRVNPILPIKPVTRFMR
jgi:hypothetical protein